MCKHYGKYDHWAKDHHSKRKAKAHIAQAEEDNEPALLMAHASVFPMSPSRPCANRFQTSTEHQPFHIVGEKVYV
jgi:hypothetical protein